MIHTVQTSAASSIAAINAAAGISSIPIMVSQPQVQVCNPIAIMEGMAVLSHVNLIMVYIKETWVKVPKPMTA